MTYHYKKKKYKLKPFGFVLILLIIALLVWVGSMVIKRGTDKSNVKITSPSNVSVVPQSSGTVSVESKLPVSSDSVAIATTPKFDSNVWNLILLNRDNLIKEDLVFAKKQYDGQYIDERVAPFYEKMCKAAKAEGIDLFLRSGFRKISLQQTYYDSNINRYLKQGKSRDEAVRLTEEYYALPGGSEHHSGLALDIITTQYQKDIHTLDERFEKTVAFKWLKKNSTKYGFILRYPRDKVDITKINYEPWHYRFVGVEHAEYMQKNNLTLEEYAKS